jgi:hypothetical protein
VSKATQKWIDLQQWEDTYGSRVYISLSVEDVQFYLKERNLFATKQDIEKILHEGSNQHALMETAEKAFLAEIATRLKTHKV